MNLPPTDFSTPAAPAGVLPGSGRAQFGQASVGALGMKWSALHDASGVIAILAGIAAEPMTPQLRNYPATLRDADGWRRVLAEQGIADLTAMLEPGLSALLAVHARGVNPAAPALALWQEFVAARDALLTLCPPQGEAGPKRFM